MQNIFPNGMLSTFVQCIDTMQMCYNHKYDEINMQVCTVDLRIQKNKPQSKRFDSKISILIGFQRNFHLFPFEIDAISNELQTNEDLMNGYFHHKMIKNYHPMQFHVIQDFARPNGWNS